MSTFECPDCAGKGITGPVHLNMGDKPHRWLETMECDFCKGTGHITPDLKEAREFGQRFRDQRRAREEALGECARRLGMKASELSALERGRGGMAAWHHPFATSAYLEATSAAKSPEGQP